MTIRLSRTGSDGRDAGFTLVELLVVLAIVGLLIMAVPAIVSAARPGVESRAAAREIAHDLSAARQTAILRGVETGVVLNAAARSYYTVPDGARHVLPASVPFSVRGAQARAKGSVIRFLPDGSSTGGTIIVGSAGKQHRIVAHWPSGRVALDE